MADYSKDNPPPYNTAGYPPAGGYPPPQAGYPPPQAGYPPQQYPPQQYPPQGYPMQQQYPGQQYPAAQPNVVVIQQANRMPPPTNAVLAWVACLCFFWPLGIVAVVKANEADRRIGRGDFEGAKQAGETAKKWAIAAIITAIVLGVLIGIIYVIVVVMAVNNAYDY